MAPSLTLLIKAVKSSITLQVTIARREKATRKQRNYPAGALSQQCLATHNDRQAWQNESPPSKILLEISPKIMVVV
jgi:hypothetical protein